MGWKQQLHFILFGAFSVVGVVLLAVAIMGKSGAAKSLEDAKGKLETAAKGTVPTKGDIKIAQDRQAVFKGEVEKFQGDLINVVGDRFRAGKVYSSRDQFYSDDVVPTIDNFRGRLKAITKMPEPPGRFKKDPENRNAKEFAALPDNKFWDELNRAMQTLTPQQIPAAQSQLKLMNDMIVVFEKLRASDAYKDTPFYLERFDFQGFAGEPAKEGTTPWLRRDFSVLMQCDPSFALAFVQEMCAPSDQTKGADADEKRRAFVPVELASIGAEMVGRPHEATYEISNKERKDWGIKPEERIEEVSSTKTRDAEDKIAEESKIVMPLRYNIKMQALELNKLWNTIKTS